MPLFLLRGVRASTRGGTSSKWDVTLVANDNFPSHDYPPARDCLRVVLVPRELSICSAGFPGGVFAENGNGNENENGNDARRDREYVGYVGRRDRVDDGQRGCATASSTVLCQTRAEGKLDRAAESAELWQLRVRSGAAFAGNEDGHDDDADADADAARSNDGAT